MSKELEALKEIFNGMYNKQGFIKEFKAIEKALTPPTAEQLCEELGEYWGACVRYNQNNNIFEKYIGGGVWKKIDLLRLRNSAPRLIKRIAQFYESEAKE